MNKLRATQLAVTLITHHLPKEWKFDWNKRKSALGVCNFRKKTIYLSEYFLGRIPDDEIKDTILHEIAHALAFIEYKHAGHGWQWKLVCRRIGAKPDRTHKGEVQNQEHRYKIKCPVCDIEFGRHRFNKYKIKQMQAGFSWFPCKCKKSRMDVYDGAKKIVDGNASKRPAQPTITEVKKMTNKELIDYLRKTGSISA